MVQSTICLIQTHIYERGKERRSQRSERELKGNTLLSGGYLLAEYLEHRFSLRLVYLCKCLLNQGTVLGTAAVQHFF